MILLCNPKQNDGHNVPAVTTTTTTTEAPTTTTPPPEVIDLFVEHYPVDADVTVIANASVNSPGQIVSLTCTLTDEQGQEVYTDTVESNHSKWQIVGQNGTCTLSVSALTASGKTETWQQSLIFTNPRYVWPVEPQYQMLLHDAYQVSSGSKIAGGFYTHNNGLMREKHYVFANRREHYGLDITAAPNSEVRATADGKILGIYTDTDSIGSTGYGKYIIIRHDMMIDGLTVYTLYAHLNKSLVSGGDQVVQGQTIALSGNTGGSRIPHLHLEFRIGDNEKIYTVDPIELLPDRDFSLFRDSLEKEKGFSDSSIHLYSNMLAGGWEYAIPARANRDFSRSGVSIDKGTQVEILSRSGSSVRFLYGGIEVSCPTSYFDYTFDY